MRFEARHGGLLVFVVVVVVALARMSSFRALGGLLVFVVVVVVSSCLSHTKRRGARVLNNGGALSVHGRGELDVKGRFQAFERGALVFVLVVHCSCGNSMNFTSSLYSLSLSLGMADHVLSFHVVQRVVMIIYNIRIRHVCTNL